MEKNERQYIGDICYIQLNAGGVLTRIADGMSIKLSATEYRILAYFIANKNQDLSLDQIANYIWGSNHEKDPDSIRSQITHIRNKLDQIQPGLGKKCIITNRGFNTYTMKLDLNIASDSSDRISWPNITKPNKTQYSGVPAKNTTIVAPIEETGIPCTINDFAISGGALFLGLDDDSESASDCDESSVSIDQDIDRILSHRSEKDASPLEKRIAELKGSKFVSKLVDTNSKKTCSFSEVDVELSGRIQGKQFNIATPSNVETILYEVSSVYDYDSKSQYLSVNPMDFIESDDHTYRTFFWDNPDPKYIIVLLSFTKLETGGYEVYINSGIYNNNQLQILKHPTLFRFEEWYFPAAIDLNDAAYDTENLPEGIRRKLIEETLPQEARWVETDLRNAPTIIIDPQNATPVLREVYFDKDDEKLKARVKLVPYKGYFIFRVLNQNTDAVCAPLKDMELGYLYRFGIHGFPKNLLLAIRHFEKEGSPNSIYQIAGVFATEEELRDEDMYLEYLQMAADMGAESAIAELAEYYCRKGDTVSVRQAQELFDKVAGPDSTIGNFLLACCLEKGLFGKVDSETIFDYYFKAACNHFEPALARLRCQHSDLQDPDLLYPLFLDSLENGNSNIDYCLGCTYFYGYGLYRRKQEGIKLLLDAANRGDKQAVRALFAIYDEDPDFNDKEEALKWLMEVDKFDPSVRTKLADRLIDGEGCVCSEENDALAFSLLEQAANSGNKVAINNLGWMYKKGRGCAVDYGRAMELFEKAGRAASLYHLGDMYENGLGVDTDIEKAIALYETASERGNKKAKKRLAEIRKKDEDAAKLSGSTEACGGASLGDSGEDEQILRSLLDHVTDIHDQVSQMNGRTERMEQQLDKLVGFVETDLKSMLAVEKRKLQKATDDDAAVAGFISTTSNYINTHIVSPDDIVEQETKHLQSLFGDNWSRLLPASRTSLISAGVLWKSCSRITKEHFDFSGVCISATSALEAELKRIFYIGFQSYLEAKYGIPDADNWETTFSNWPEKLLSTTRLEFKKAFEKYRRNSQRERKPILTKGKAFTMGVLPFMFGKADRFRDLEQEELLRTRLIEYLGSIVADSYKSNPIRAFYDPNDRNCVVERSERVRRDYRNKAAHVDVISRNQAEECYQQVIGKIDALEYASDVTGLIIDLYDKLNDKLFFS